MSNTDHYDALATAVFAVIQMLTICYTLSLNIPISYTDIFLSLYFIIDNFTAQLSYRVALFGAATLVSLVII